MSMVKMLEYDEASPEARAVFDDIMATRKTDWVNNFWKAVATHPPTMRRFWEDAKQVMAPGALDPLVKELINVAVSVTNNCEYAFRMSFSGFALLSLAVVVAVAGASAAIYGWARTERRGATTASVVYLAMAFVGGSFIPLESLPASLRPVAPFTPFYWGTTGYLALMDRGAGWVEVLPNVAVLGLMGGVLLALGAFALRRAVSRSVTA